MKTQAIQIKERLKNISCSDIKVPIDRLMLVLKSDLTQLFSNYMYVLPQNVMLEANHGNEGELVFVCSIKTDYLFDFGTIL